MKQANSSWIARGAAGPERMPWQWAYLLVYGLTLAAALWQHGHARLILILLLACVPAACVPVLSYRRLGRWLRLVAQGVVLLAAGCWVFYRLRLKTPPDLLLVEALAIAGFAFVFMTRLRDFRYLGLIGVVLLIYGAVYPREAYLWLLPAALLIMLLLSYRNRTVGLTDDPLAVAAGNAFLRNPGHVLLHLSLATVLGIYFYGLFPAGGATGEGVLPVSFRHGRRGHIPPALDRWFETPHHHAGQQGKARLTTLPPSAGATEGRHQTDVAPPPMVPGEGDGGGGASPPGRELVMTVSAPLKLYWLCQLYDEYDGRVWRASEAMRAQELPPWGRHSLLQVHVEQEVTIHRWHSAVLPSAYRVSFFTLPTGYGGRLATTFYHGRLPAEDLPPPPFTYKINSLVSAPVAAEISAMAAALDDVWAEDLPQEHYRQLPTAEISRRLRALAGSLTRDAATPMAQALALRDYLRREYPYDLAVPPPPSGREATDYFLFELRRGHCEYFAGALVVLARCRGLAARVATGFSPGDYHLLKQVFEVREYHAHAWAQIFIPGEGWLTFDPTPPGEVPSRALPAAFARMHDPFGDEWRVMPPERTALAREFLQANSIMNLAEMAERGGEEVGTIAGVLNRVPTTEEELRETMQRIREAAASAGLAQGNQRLAAMRANAVALVRRLRSSLAAFGRWLIGPSGVATLCLTVMAAAWWLVCPMLVGEWRRWRRLRRCRHLFARIEAERDGDPRTVIRQCYRLSRELLSLAGFQRPRQIDLLDYGRALGEVAAALGEDAQVVFALHTQFAYSGQSPAADDAARAFQSAVALRRNLLVRMRLMGRLG